VGVQHPKSPKLVFFWYKFAQKGYTPLSEFLQNLAWGRYPRFAPSRQILPFWLNKCGLTARNIAKNGNFWYKFAPKGYIPLNVFFTIFVWGREPQDRTLKQNFAAVVLKMWPYGPQNGNFW